MKTFCFKTMIAVFILFITNEIQAQTQQAQTNPVAFGTRDIVHSKILNEQRRIWVWVPNSATSQVYSKQSYPVVYLLDGGSHFTSTVGMIQSLSSALVCPEMIVVGILNVDRMRDFTPTHMEAFQFLDLIDTVSPNKTGGGEKFISFVEKELIPHVDSLYPTAPYRIFIGHSAGGLAVMNTLINHPNLFKAYVAIDPAMLWDNQKFLKESEKILAKNNYSGISLFLGIANTLPAGMDTIKVKNDKTKITEHIRSLFELRYNLNENKKNQLKFGCKFYQNENHESVPLITIFDAFRFLFGYYHLSFFNNDYKYIENLYDKVSEQFGYKVIPPESIINTRANAHLYYKMYDAALYLYKLNVANYPESYNVYNSIGDYYTATGDNASAINNYQKALSIKEVPAVRQKLEKLQVK